MIKKSIVSILTILILIHSIGCYSYSQFKKEDIIEIENKDKVRITTIDEKVYHLKEVEIEGSILKGYRYEIIYRRDLQRREKVIVGDQVLIPTNHIKEMEVDEFNPYLTVAVIMAIPVTIFLIVLAGIGDGI